MINNSTSNFAIYTFQKNVSHYFEHLKLILNSENMTHEVGNLLLWFCIVWYCSISQFHGVPCKYKSMRWFEIVMHLFTKRRARLWKLPAKLVFKACWSGDLHRLGRTSFPMHLFRPSIMPVILKLRQKQNNKKPSDSSQCHYPLAFINIFTSKGFDLNFCAPLADKTTCSCNTSSDGRNISIGSKDRTLLIWYSDLLAIGISRNCQVVGKCCWHWQRGLALRTQMLLDSRSKWAE